MLIVLELGDAEPPSSSQACVQQLEVAFVVVEATRNNYVCLVLPVADVAQLVIFPAPSTRVERQRHYVVDVIQILLLVGAHMMLLLHHIFLVSFNVVKYVGRFLGGCCEG